MSEGLLFANFFGDPQTVAWFASPGAPLGAGIVHVGMLSHWNDLLVGYLHRTEPSLLFLVTDVLVNRVDKIYGHTWTSVVYAINAKIQWKAIQFVIIW